MSLHAYKHTLFSQSRTGYPPPPTPHQCTHSFHIRLCRQLSGLSYSVQKTHGTLLPVTPADSTTLKQHSDTEKEKGIMQWQNAKQWKKEARTIRETKTRRTSEMEGGQQREDHRRWQDTWKKKLSLVGKNVEYPQRFFKCCKIPTIFFSQIVLRL